MTGYLARDAFASDLVAGHRLEGAQLRKQFNTQIDKAAGNRARRFCISTGTEDRDRDVVNPSGWRLDAYRRNPTVLWAHDYSALPLAKCTDIALQGVRLLATAVFAEHEMANTVLQLIDGGFLNATSVGFRPIKYNFNASRNGVDFDEQELLEFSIVPVPANPEALIEARSAGVDLAPVRAWAQTILKRLGAAPARRPSDPDELIIDGAPILDDRDLGLSRIDSVARRAHRRFEQRVAEARAELAAVPDDAVVVNIEDGIDLDAATFKAAMREGLAPVLRAVVQGHVEAAVDKLRGRVR
jgi:HK97 family phage prohead protease